MISNITIHDLIFKSQCIRCETAKYLKLKTDFPDFDNLRKARA